MPSATVRGSYACINTIFDPPKFSLDTTFKARITLFCDQGIMSLVFCWSQKAYVVVMLTANQMIVPDITTCMLTIKKISIPLPKDQIELAQPRVSDSYWYTVLYKFLIITNRAQKQEEMSWYYQENQNCRVSSLPKAKS